MKIQELISELKIPSSIKKKDYPKVVWTQVDGNAFSIMGTAKNAWRKVDAGVSSRIASVCMRGDYATLLEVCVAICPMGSDDNEDN